MSAPVIANSSTAAQVLAIRRLSRLQRLILEEVGRECAWKRGKCAMTGDDYRKQMGEGYEEDDDDAVRHDAYERAVQLGAAFGLGVGMTEEQFVANGQRYVVANQKDWIRLALICRKVFGRYAGAPGTRRRQRLAPITGTRFLWDTSGSPPPTAAFRASFSRALKALVQAGLLEHGKSNDSVAGYAAVRPTLAFTMFVARRGFVVPGDYIDTNYTTATVIPCGSRPPGSYELGDVEWVTDGDGRRWPRLCDEPDQCEGSHRFDYGWRVGSWEKWREYLAQVALR